MQGDYEIISAADNRTIEPSEFATVAEPGMVFEMSIVLHRNTTLEGNGTMCPRCRNNNQNVIAENGWIEWKVSLIDHPRLAINTVDCSRYCQGRFRVGKADENRKKHEEIRGGRRKELKLNASRDEARNDDKGDDDTKEVVSPAAYVPSFSGASQS